YLHSGLHWHDYYIKHAAANRVTTAEWLNSINLALLAFFERSVCHCILNMKLWKYNNNEVEFI
ncbi:hypothetical protein, partial [Vibrio anguillarum]|uniref:hypothetical protein n=1 Tax=Vibrio anguillarum TaxID=55601 RepID=UPI001BE3D634